MENIFEIKFSFEQNVKDNVILKFSNKQGGAYNVFSYHWQCFVWAAVVGFIHNERRPLQSPIADRPFSLNTMCNGGGEKDAEALLCMCIAKVGSLDIMKEPTKAIDLINEYANGGFYYIMKMMQDQSITNGMGQTRNIYEMNMIINWLKCHMRKLIFFVVFFMGFGTSSIWMSALFLDIDCKDIVVGILTISIAAVYTSAERILTFMMTKRIENNEDIVELIAVSVPIIISCIVIGLLEKCIVASAILASITYLLYCRLWWYQNRDNKTFDNSSNALGGGIEQFK